MYPNPNNLVTGTVEVNTVSEMPKKYVSELKQFIKKRIDKEDQGEKRSELMTRAHLLNHQGSQQLFKKLFDDGYNGDTMKRDCNDFVATCKECFSYNVTQGGFHPLSPITAELPFDHVALDLFGPMTGSASEYSYGLILTYIATRFLCLAPLKDKTAKSVAHALFPWFCTFGYPKILQYDNGTEFVNAIISKAHQSLPS